LETSIPMDNHSSTSIRHDGFGGRRGKRQGMTQPSFVLAELPWKHSIYIIGGADKPVKIGYAKNVNERLQSLQTGSPQELYVFDQFDRLTLKEARAIERAVHKHFASKRLKGEWFDIGSDEARQAITDRLDTRVKSARMLSSFDLRGHIAPQSMVEMIQVADRDISNGSEIQTQAS
jgi:predicted GIY-YIG superfamily endonuclease